MTQIEQKKNQDNVLQTLLEQFVLNPEDLKVLKQKINQFTTGELTSTELKEYLLQSRITILNNLKRFFPFYAKKVNSDGNYAVNEIDGNAQNDGEIIKLNRQLHEREALLQALVPRILTLEEKVGITPTHTPTSLNSNTGINWEEEIKRALNAININHWLLVFLTNEDGTINRSDYQFYQRFFTTLTEYHDYRFSVPEGEKVTNLERIEHLVKSEKLRDAVVKLLMVRNNLSHSLYKLSNEDVDHAYITYFQFICYLLKQELNQDIVTTHKSNIRTFLIDFITEIFNNDTFIASIGCKIINNFF
ncbi:MAG: hypothetical protein EAX89_06540 [Candidatus Lokiarchaeota archaeon]|nr:hypothetical protein [Candidatus Lokiarchaeota archaeon]